MKNSKNDFPLVWSKTKAPNELLPVVMTLRWQTAGRWGSWGWSHTCTMSLGNSWVWSWHLALLSVDCKAISQAGGLNMCSFLYFQIGKQDWKWVVIPRFEFVSWNEEVKKPHVCAINLLPNSHSSLQTSILTVRHKESLRKLKDPEDPSLSI